MPGPFIFNPDIPLATDRPSQSQGEILQNFTSINDIWNENHYTFASANAGKHKFCSLVEQTGAPAAAPAEFQFYTFNYPVSGNDELYIRRSSDNALRPSVQIPFTAGSTSYAWLPSGLLMKWGNQQLTDGSGTITTNTQTITYPVGATIPAFTGAAYTIMLTDSSASIGDGIDPNFHFYIKELGTALNFTVRVYRRTASNGAPSPVEFKWVAIGPGV